MADSDPISESTPYNKKRRLHNGAESKIWNSDEDSGDDLFNEHETIPTQPLKRPLQGSRANDSQYGRFSYTTQPTQPKTQVNYQSQTRTQDMRSSPPVLTSPAPPQKPAPLTRAPFSKPGGLLASAAMSMAPRGTLLRKPVTQRRDADADSDMSDPPVEHSDDEDSRHLKSNIRPTKFVNGKRDLGSSPPRQQQPPSLFSKLVSGFKHEQGDDMASAYGTSRPPRPPVPRHSGIQYKTLDDIDDLRLRQSVQRIKNVLHWATVQQSVDALKRKNGNAFEAMNWLSEHKPSPSKVQSLSDISDPSIRQSIFRMREMVPDIDVARCYAALQKSHFNESDAIDRLMAGDAPASNTDELALTPQPARRGQAVPVPKAVPMSKQAMKAPMQSIAERYGTQRAPIEIGDEDARPRKRLLKGRRPRSPSPEYAARERGNRVIDVDDESEAVESEVEVVQTFDERVLQFFNEAKRQELLDLSTQPEEDIDLVISKRPFKTLAAIRKVDRPPPVVKGKRAPRRAVGERVLDTCEEMLQGYDAVDQLVDQCEKLAEPIQKSLKAWGVGKQEDGELHLMKLDELNDSGIGTPLSAYDDGKKSKAKFLSQPSNMSTDVILKDYQLVGLNWLHLLYGVKTSCILADDMGLGKTCQVIAFLAQLQIERVNGIHLVIVPGSTLENWLRELKRFAPSLSVFVYYGGQNERLDQQDQLDAGFSDYDVVVTTYDMAVKDNKFIRKLEPIVCVYDEAHQLRNPKSDRYSRLMRIKAGFKVLLTGTPLQNNLQELVAILAFLMPDMFEGKREDLEFIFKHKASTNDANHAALLSAQRTARARSMITPFILRRKKVQVLDLPAKHSRVEMCELTETQSELYAEMQSQVRRLFKERAAGQKKLTRKTGNILMDLRKAAIHPLLKRQIYTDKKLEKITDILVQGEEFGGNPRDMILKHLNGEGNGSLAGNDFSIHRFCEERPELRRYMLKNEEWMDSGKVLKFKELVQRFAKNGDKILVFSQFVMVMDILEAVLETLHVKYMRLDGSTSMNIRQGMIDQFNTEPEITIFMLSTKAGGAGINLASANKVIIFDSGFNPQDDIQAENRAHRVGQTREVEVIRLVSIDTIEEQIHTLGESKVALDEMVAGEGSTAAEDRAAEKSGAEAVEKMLMEKLAGEEEPAVKAESKAKKLASRPKDEESDSAETKDELAGVEVVDLGDSDEDVKHAFKRRLQSNGLHID